MARRRASRCFAALRYHVPLVYPALPYPRVLPAMEQPADEGEIR
jgi:hypothetical protein